MTYTFAKVLNELSPILSTETFSKDEVIEMLQRLQKEYAPTIEMTKDASNTLWLYRKYGYFEDFVQEIWVDYSISRQKYKGLSIEDIMQAWLYPEAIKVVDE